MLKSCKGQEGGCQAELSFDDLGIHATCANQRRASWFCYALAMDPKPSRDRKREGKNDRLSAHLCVYIYKHIHISMYLCTGREREREIEGERVQTEANPRIHIARGDETWSVKSAPWKDRTGRCATGRASW